MSEPKRKVTIQSAWRDSRDLIYRHRQRLALGLVLMIISRLAGLVLPASSKYLIDHVIVAKQYQMLLPLAGAVFLATLI